jgi:TRAP-type C4-dicarboxylate transport system permease large subunit
MNCQRCNASIDYRFISTCPVCGCEVEVPSLSRTTPIQTVVSSQKLVRWKRAVLNAVYVFASSLVGLISGAIVTYAGAGIVFGILSQFIDFNVGCGTGTLIGLLTIVSGAILGSVSGSAVAIKHPLCKAAFK